MEGVSLLSVKLSVYRELSHFVGELQCEKIPAVIPIPKIWTILKSQEFHFCPKFRAILEPREFYSRGVSNLSLKLTVL